MADEAVDADDDDYDSEEDTEPIRAETSSDDSYESWYRPIKEKQEVGVGLLIAFFSLILPSY